MVPISLVRYSICVSKSGFLEYLLSFRETAYKQLMLQAQELEDERERASPASASSDSEEAETDSEEDEEQRQSSDLDRQLPGFLAQCRVIMHRALLHWWRRQATRLLFLSVVLVGAGFVGCLERYVFKTPPFMPEGVMNAMLTLGLLTSVYTLPTFGDDLALFWRESSHGLSKVAHTVGKISVETIDWALMTFFFATTYYLITAPKLAFQTWATTLSGREKSPADVLTLFSQAWSNKLFLAGSYVSLTNLAAGSRVSPTAFSRGERPRVSFFSSLPR